MEAMRFDDRHDAGRRLAAELVDFAAEQPVVVALPRGGVPVAAEVARVLAAPLEILAVRKLGAPGNPELGVGAVAEDGIGVLDPRSAEMSGMTQAMLDETLARESSELRRRVERYRDGRAAISVKGRTVIVVDDGLATGLTDLAAVRALRKLGARRIVVAVPVGAAPAVSMLEQEADRVICLTSPEPLLGVGAWYRDFAPTSDEEVVALLSQAAERADAQTPSIAAGSEAVPLRTEDEARNETLTFDLGGVRLTGNLTLPPTAFGLVLFAHGSGSSRMSPRNRAVAQALNDAGLATLLFDLLDDREALDRNLVFDVELLARRLQEVTRWAASEAAVSALPIGYFGASTGAAAALIAAAATPDAVAAVVCRGGRPDLAGHRLADVRAPTLLIVGGNDPEVLDLNRQAAARLLCPHEVVVVDAAGHLFEERGALERVAELAIDWFKRQLAQPVQALSRAGEQ
jgi:putative phosphoribosyl transferase